ncbi:MAG: acyl-CoA dehydrogenase family protein [Micromonosporaceae bacterium]
MSFLAPERDTLRRILPGLDEALAVPELTELEQPGNVGITRFKEAGGPGLLVPPEHGGCGATAREAVRVTRAIGSRAPSLAIATTMHNFSVASLVALANHSDGFEWMLLDAVANDRLLVSSAFAEGHSGRGVLDPTMTAVRDGGQWRVNGRKKPCSLSRSMDLITASVALREPDGGETLGVALIPAASEGITVRPFWRSGVLTGAESDEVVLTDVLVDENLMIRPKLDPGSNLDDLQTVGFIWFSLLVAASYLGMASALVERLLAADRGGPAGQAGVLIELEFAALAVDRAAWALDEGDTGNDALARALIARYGAHRAIRDVVNQTVGMLGGIGFISSPDVAYLSAACQAVQFHPPSQHAMAGSFAAYFAGGDLRVQ